VSDLAIPVELVGADTMRETDGLAMSSRNQYLTAEQRPVAAEIHRTLQSVRAAVVAGADMAGAENEARATLERHGFAVDYVAIRRPDLTAAGPGKVGRVVVLVAARLGQTRLIDNLEFDAS